jgi:peptidoglycan/xylan/chitin deacetylase (PgdA/CDA1 family)
VSDVLVLCYHALSDAWQAALAISRASFESQVDYLLERGYRAATFTEALTAPSAPRTVVFTFDDGFRSVLEHALPILSSRGLQATVFVPTDFPGGKRLLCWEGIDHWRGGRYERELTPMSWDDLRRLQGQGWEVGSHTCSHPQLRRLDDRRLLDELTRSRQRCEEELGVPCLSLAYPYGDVDRRVVGATRRAGYRVAATLPDRLPRAQRVLEWPRVGVYGADALPRFQAKVAPLGRWLVGRPAGEWLLRRELGRSG